jgi:mono/diheme cytochrome c family protein
VDVRQPRATTRAALRDLIRAGLPEAGMPPFAMPEAELDAIAGFVASEIAGSRHPVAGNAAG